MSTQTIQAPVPALTHECPLPEVTDYVGRSVSAPRRDFLSKHSRLSSIFFPTPL